MTDDEYEAAVAACPTPAYHETHRYCPSCPWTEQGPLHPEPTVSTEVWLRVVAKNNTQGRVVGIDIPSITKARPRGKGAYMKLRLTFPRRLFEIPDTTLEVSVTDSMLEGAPAQIIADLADLRAELDGPR